MPHNVPKDPPMPNEIGLYAVPFLTAARIFADAAEEVGIPHETVSRWLADPAYREVFDKEWDESPEISTARVRLRILRTISTLAELLDSHVPDATATRPVTILDLSRAREEREREANKRFLDLIANAMNDHSKSCRTEHCDVPRPGNQAGDGSPYPTLRSLLSIHRYDP